jgi:hypothetical protein
MASWCRRIRRMKRIPYGPDRNGRSKHTERSCLRCDRKFMSKGIANRICPDCMKKMLLYPDGDFNGNNQGWIYVG